MVADREDVRLNDLTRLVLLGVLESEFADETLRGDLSLVEHSHLRLRDKLFANVFKADLNRAVAVLLHRFDLRDDARAGLKDRHGGEHAVIREDLGHANLFCKNRFFHVFLLTADRTSVRS